jgi:DNA topoisomerase I
VYLDPAGERVEDPEVMERIAALAIPPAWKDVWICMDARGHLQATGLDAAGRKQYLYHERWRAHRDRAKFDAMLGFGEALPGLRRRVARDLGPARADAAAHGVPLAVLEEPVVLAATVRLLDVGFFRVGSDDYVRQNDSYGLTTILREHVALATGGRAVFDFPAKSNQRRVQEIADAEAVRVVAALKRRRGGSGQLLAYRACGDGNGTRGAWSDLHADEVNTYIKRHTGGGFTAKDFRTWHASVMAAVSLARFDGQPGERSRERAVRAAIEDVSRHLGNTPAVCRASYIDPRVIDRYRAGTTIAPAIEGISLGAADGVGLRARGRVERAVLELLRDA